MIREDTKDELHTLNHITNRIGMANERFKNRQPRRPNELKVPSTEGVNGQVICITVILSGEDTQHWHNTRSLHTN